MLKRPRRLRVNEKIRGLVRETQLGTEDLIYPIFVVEGEGQKQSMESMPGIHRYSLDMIHEEIDEMKRLGLGSVMIFGVPAYKDCHGSGAYDDNGIVQRAIRKIRELDPDMNIITDVCMCQYTDHGHCGIIDGEGHVDNDITLGYLQKIAVSHAKAGADMIAPSDMMDGRIAAIREALDKEGFKKIPIMAYSAKYASSFYGPFRDAAESAPAFGDRKTYQMDPANTNEAMHECELDIEEGADIIMIKPAIMYLDVIRRASERFSLPIAAYNVSGEYSMIKTAVLNGYFSEDAIYEAVLSIKRAGADIIITYFAKDIAERLNKR